MRLDLMALDFSNSLKWDDSTYSGEMIISFVVMGIVAIIAICIGLVFHKKDPTKKDKNKFITVVCALVEMLDNQIIEIMGKRWQKFAGYIMALAMYIIFCFLIGLTGLPNPLTELAVPLSLGLITFVMIHATAIKTNKWGYFRRYIDPIPVFLPINLLSMWAPLLSITLRLFGNALVGYCLMTLVYFYLQQISAMIFAFIPVSGLNSVIVAPFVTPWLHLYFDLFSGMIQTLVFCVLTMIWVSQEGPQDEEDDQVFLKQEGAN